MSKITTAINLLKHKRGEFFASILMHLNFLFPDKLYLTLLFRFKMGYWMDWKNPKTFNEKLNWLKLYDRKPIYTKIVDKYLVKDYIKEIIGEEYIIPTLGVWDSPDDIDWDSLPQRFVLKTTHGGGNAGIIICKDKSTIDVITINKQLAQAMRQNLYMESREWPYKNVERKIIAEEYLEDTVTNELRDYKFFCFNGEVKYLYVATGRQKYKEPYFNFFDADYNSLDFQQGHPKSDFLPSKPLCFDEMKMLARKLSKGFSEVRVDLYEVNGKVYFGEMTLFHMAGFSSFDPNEWDYKLGELIKLPFEN